MRTFNQCQVFCLPNDKQNSRFLCECLFAEAEKGEELERSVVIVADVDAGVERYAVRMNIAVSRAFGALRVVVGRSELERDEMLRRVVEMGEGGIQTVS